MEICGYKLPDKFLSLILNKESQDLPIVSKGSLQKLVPAGVEVMGGFIGGVQLFSLESIKRESLSEHLLDSDEMAKLYAIGSSKKSATPITDLHILDVNKALFIAGNYDEETIALDYRVNPQNPRVLGSFMPRDWVLLADSFEDFVKQVEL